MLRKLLTACAIALCVVFKGGGFDEVEQQQQFKKLNIAMFSFLNCWISFILTARLEKRTNSLYVDLTENYNL
jgi:hypothetical protein